MPSESEHIVSLYERHAPAYDALRGRNLFEKAWLDRFIALLPQSGSALDIGCGMGEPIARYLIENNLRVTGVDSSPSLIALCKERFSAQSWMVADMRTLSLDQRFDGLLAWDSFFHLTQDAQRAMFPLFTAHAEPKAVLMFTSGPADGTAIGRFEGEPLYHASLDPDEYRALLKQNGFSVVAHKAEDAECGGHTIWLAQRD